MSSFVETSQKKPNGYKEVKYVLNKKKTGLKDVIINDTKGTIRINASSKILGSNYPKGINLNTLDQFIDELKLCGIELNKDFVNDCQLNRVDIKNDLKTEKETCLYINSLNQLISPKFIKTNYDTSIVFKERIKTNPLTFTGYSKMHEIESNKSLYKELPNMKASFKNTLRIETRLPKGKTISKYFKSRGLIEILSSSNFNLNILNKVIDNQTNFKPFVNIWNMTNAEEKSFAQIYYLNQYYRGDFNRIMNHIKNKLAKKTNASPYRKSVKKYLSVINNNSDSFFEYLEEMRTKLKEQKHQNSLVM